MVSTMETKTLKDRCREVMMAHLHSKGYPNLTMEGIVGEIRAMWNALDEAGLMPELKAQGWTYQQFTKVAKERALIAVAPYNWTDGPQGNKS